MTSVQNSLYPVVEPMSGLINIAVPVHSFKPSRFNAHTIADDGALLLFNSLSGHHCVIPKSQRAVSERYLAKAGFNGPLDAMGQYLLRKRYIVSSDEDEMATWNIRYGKQQYRTDILQLTLLSTEECNFRCVYCSQEFKRGLMRPTVRRGVQRLFESRARFLESMSVAWFGGEPLLGYPVVEELAPYFAERTKALGISYSSHITTNAFLLTPERSRELLAWEVVDYQITIDGMAAVHNHHRPLDGGGDTFETIISNLEAMASYDYDFSVALRVNFDKNTANDIRPLFEYLATTFKADSRFKMRFRTMEQWGGPNDDQLNVCGLKDGRDTLVQLEKTARSVGMPTEEIAKMISPEDGVCYAARPYHLVVGSDGKLMKCTVLLDTKESNIIGMLDETSMTVNDARLSQWIKPFYQQDEVCRSCFYLPACQGASCPLPRFQGERPCPPMKLQIGKTLKDIYQQTAPVLASR